MEQADNFIKYQEALGRAIGKSPPFTKILAAANPDGMASENKRMEAGLWLFVFGATDQKILTCYRTYWSSARDTQEGGVLLKRMLAECMDEALLAQYERGMALFCLIAEGLPGSWQPAADVKKRIKEKVRPLITGVEGKAGAGNFERRTG